MTKAKTDRTRAGLGLAGMQCEGKIRRTAGVREAVQKLAALSALPENGSSTLGNHMVSNPL